MIVFSQTLHPDSRWNESTHQKEEEWCASLFQFIFFARGGWGGLFLALQCNWAEGYFSPHHLTCPAARAVTDKPRGFALRLKPADGTVVLMGHFGELEAARGRTEGGSYRVIVAVSRLWNAREKWGEWMNQCHGNKNKEEAVWLRLPGRLFLLFSWISLITNSKMFNRADSLLMLMGSHDFYAIFAQLPRKQMGKTKQKLQFDHVSHSR